MQRAALGPAGVYKVADDCGVINPGRCSLALRVVQFRADSPIVGRDARDGPWAGQRAVEDRQIAA